MIPRLQASLPTWLWPARLRLYGVAIAATFLTACAQKTTAYQGYVEGEFLYIASSQSGQLAKLAVEKGQTVAEGALLFVLESQYEADAVAQAQSQLKASKLQHTDQLSGRRPPEIAVIESQVERARIHAEQAELQRIRDEAQWNAGGIAREQVDNSRAMAHSAHAQLRELEAQLRVAQLPNRESQIRAQGAQVEASQAALNQAQWRLKQKEVRAQQAGLVFDTLYRSGEWVPVGSPVVRMLNLQKNKVRFFVPDAALGALSLGRSVVVRCSGCTADLAATISYISDQAEFTPPNIYSNDTRSKMIFMVEARPSPAEAVKLHPGQAVDVVLQ